MNLNETIDVSPAAGGIAGTTIACRHFATAAVNDGDALSRFMLGQNEIRDYFEQRGLGLIESEYDQFIQSPAQNKALVSNGQFGAWLQWQAESMTSSRAGAIVNTPDHSVAVIIERAHHVGSFNVTCYDPDRTLQPNVLSSQSLEQISQLSFLECFPNVCDQAVAISQHGMTVTAISLGVKRNDSCKFLDFAHPSQQDLHHCFATSLYAALQFNIHDAVMPIAERIRAQGYEENDVVALFSLGELINDRYKSPALAAAERNGTSEVLSQAPELFEKLGLSSPLACRFLSAEYGGWPALLHAARKGNLEMVEAITDAIVDLKARYDDIEADMVVELLKGASVEYHSELESDSEHEYVTAETSDPARPIRADESPNHMDPEDIKRESADTPALHLAAYQGHAGMYPIIADALVRLEVPMEQRMEILAAPDGAGRPALWRAMVNEHFGCYDALSKAAQKANLELHQQEELLIARDPATGLAAHQVAIMLGNADACVELAAALHSVGIPDDRIHRALLSSDDNGRDTCTLCANSPELSGKLDRTLARFRPQSPASPQRRSAISGQQSRRSISPASEQSPAKRIRR